MDREAVDGEAAEVVNRHVPVPKRIMMHLGVIVLVALVGWLSFFWLAPISLIIPPEASQKLAPGDGHQLRLFFGIMLGMLTIMVGVLGYALWLMRQGRKARKEVLGKR